MSIKINATKRSIRECTAPFQQDGTKQNIRVLYYSFKIKELKDHQARVEEKAKQNPDAIIWLSETLSERLHSLPDLTDANGKEFKITADNLDLIDVENLEAIKRAIDEDVSGKSRPSS